MTDFMRGRRALYLVGLLEKFAFNGLRAMLVLYFIKSVAISDARAFEIYGALMTFAFLIPVFIGYWADRYHRWNQMIVWGAGLSSIGAFSLLFDSVYALCFGLGAVVIGSALVRSIVPTYLGHLMDRFNVTDRDGHFTYLYVSFNIGTFLGALLCAGLGEIFGWTFSFCLAGFGMFLIIFVIKKNRSFFSSASVDSSPPHSLEKWIPGLLALASMAVGLAILFLSQHIAILIPIILICSVGFLLNLALKSEIQEAWRLYALMILFFGIIMFFALFEQAALSLTTFTEKLVQREIGGILIPTTFFQSIDPGFNIVFGGLLTMLWSRWKLQNAIVQSLVKYAFGFLITSLSFLVIMVSLTFSGYSLVSPLVMVAAYGIFVIAELCIVPIGFSAVSQFVNPAFRATAMGILFACVGTAMWLAGFLSKLTPGLSVNDGDLTALGLKYFGAFAIFAKLSLATAVTLIFVCLLFHLRMKKFLAVRN